MAELRVAPMRFKELRMPWSQALVVDFVGFSLRFSWVARQVSGKSSFLDLCESLCFVGNGFLFVVFLLVFLRGPRKVCLKASGF